MSQKVGDIVINMDVDTAKVAAGLQTASNGLGKLVDSSDLVEKRIRRCMESSARSVAASAKSISAAMAQSQVATRIQSDAMAQLAREANEARERAVDLNQKLRAEAAQAAVVAQAQDAAAAAFYRQIDSVKQLSGGLQELQRIQAQVRQAKGRGDISQGDYLALVSEAAAKTRELTDAEALATQKKAQFIRRLKEQTAVQGLSRTELLRVKAAELGVSSAADVYIRKLDTATKSTHALGLKSAMARREIGVLIGELARGNFGALRGSGITLANRAGWMEQLMSPKGMMLGGLAGGVAAAVYGLGKAYYEGAKESEEFNKQLILTGSYAGKTTGKLNEMAKSLAGNGVTQHDAAGVLIQVVGMGDQQRGRYEERLKIQQHYQEQLEQLKRDSKAKGTYGSDEYRQAEQELQASLDRRLAEWADYNAKVDAAQGDWTQGASRALDNFLAQGGNVAGMTENVFTNAFNGMADSIANFAVTGKGSFRSLTVSILADLAKMEARIAASKLLGSVLGMFGFGASAGGSTPSGAYSSAALSVIPNADGGVYRSAGLSQYSGSIVNRPTFFAFARGAAVMGEAGPEAILPLRRGTDGKLGVVAAGSGGMAMFAPQYHIAISNTGPELTPQALKAVYDLGKKAAADFVQQQGRDGGRLSGAYR